MYISILSQFESPFLGAYLKCSTNRLAWESWPNLTLIYNLPSSRGSSFKLGKNETKTWLKQKVNVHVSQPHTQPGQTKQYNYSTSEVRSKTHGTFSLCINKYTLAFLKNEKHCCLYLQFSVVWSVGSLLFCLCTILEEDFEFCRTLKFEDLSTPEFEVLCSRLRPDGISQ